MQKLHYKKILFIAFLFRDLYASEENQLTKSELLHDKYVSKLKQEAENNAHLRR
jgi:hypothetical protein